MAYTPQTWSDAPATTTPISAARLNYMEAGIAAAGTGGGGTGGPVTIAGLPPGSTVTVPKDRATGFWPTGYDSTGKPVYTGGSSSTGLRPTSRADITVVWKGADPSPAVVSSGTAGMLNNVDVRFVTT